MSASHHSRVPGAHSFQRNASSGNSRHLGPLIMLCLKEGRAIDGENCAAAEEVVVKMPAPTSSAVLANPGRPPARFSRRAVRSPLRSAILSLLTLIFFSIQTTRASGIEVDPWGSY